MFSLSQDSSWNQVSLCTVIILLFPRPRNFSCLVLSCLPHPPPPQPPFLSAIPFLPSHHHYHDHPDYSSHTFTRDFFSLCFQRRRILRALLWEHARCNGLLSFLSAKTFNEYNMSPLNSYLQRVRYNSLLPTVWLRFLDTNPVSQPTSYVKCRISGNHGELVRYKSAVASLETNNT